MTAPRDSDPVGVAAAQALGNQVTMFAKIHVKDIINCARRHFFLFNLTVLVLRACQGTGALLQQLESRSGLFFVYVVTFTNEWC